MTTCRPAVNRLRKIWAGLRPGRDRVPDDIRQQLPLADIGRVTFYKRDELTTDLICCEVEACGQTWFFHEEADGWEEFLCYLERLPNFRTDWPQAVGHPAFAANETVAFERG